MSATIQPIHKENQENTKFYSGKLYTISALAKEFDVTTRTIRFYESEGMLFPARQGRKRIYTLRDRTRLKLILRGKRLGFSLNEIAEMFALYDSEPGETGQLTHILAKVGEKQSQLERQLEDIDVMMQELKDFQTQCECRLQAMENNDG